MWGPRTLNADDDDDDEMPLQINLHVDCSDVVRPGSRLCQLN